MKEEKQISIAAKAASASIAYTVMALILIYVTSVQTASITMIVLFGSQTNAMYRKIKEHEKKIEEFKKQQQR